MIDYDDNRALISIHIPKCGGSSFLTVLQQWFGDRFKSHYFDEAGNKMPPRHDLNQSPGICIHGHFNMSRGFGIQDYYPEVQQFITMLRDPFEMCLSNYFYVKKCEQLNINYRDGKKYYLDELNNYVKNASSFMLLHMPCIINMDNYKEVIDSKFVYIGICEDMQSSVDVLAHKLKMPRIDIGFENVSERDETIPKEFREEFIRRHPVEYAVYSYAVQKYHQV